MLDIAIIGGGLAGLSLAQGLWDTQRSIAVFEARERFGGRILSVPEGPGFRYDLGPSWIWPELQPRLAEFITRYALDVYPQWCEGISFYQRDRLQAPQAYRDEGTYAGACRIEGGVFRLVEVLLQTLPHAILKAEHCLREVIDQGNHIELIFEWRGEKLSVKASQVVITIPPRLLAKSVTFKPALDARLQDVMLATPTWMAGHAKALIRYAKPFWREAGLSGSALSAYPGAAMAEIYDATAKDGTHAALSGFLALPATLRRQHHADLDALILEQLVRLFGKEAARPDSIRIHDWCEEPLTATAEDAVPPAGHPHYGHPWIKLDHWTDKLYFSGTETASDYGGYLEGALESAERVMAALLQPSA
ncbi:MAG: NAD(P)-binding protein [Gammaproteobacteria bacterium]|nr:NAD(P)-binding protein [Gammaproteobacteria bacterium]